MNTRFFGVLLLAGLTSCEQVSDKTVDQRTVRPDSANPANPAPQDESEASPVAFSPDGWGVLSIGMTRAEVVTAAGEKAGGGAAPSGECEVFTPKGAPDGMTVMIEKDRLTRITISEPSRLKTARGFTIGDPAAAIKKAYGAEAQVTPHKYDPAPSEYITFWTTPGSRGLVYEIGKDGNVKHIHAGGPSIQYVEGCG